MTLAGADQLDQTLAKIEADINDPKVSRDAAEMVLKTARAKSRSSRVRRTGRVSARNGSSTVEFGSPAVPFTAASHFGHGSPSRPRRQGGWMPANRFVFDAADQREDDVVDHYDDRTVEVIRKAGF